MNELSLGFYCAGALSDLVALGLAAPDIRRQIRLIRAGLTVPSPPLIENEDLGSVERMVKALSPAEMEARRRKGANEDRAVIAAVSTAISWLSSYVGATGTRRRLIGIGVSLIIGTLMGAAGNIAGAV